MNEIIEELNKIMNQIEYGVPNEKNKNLLEIMDEDEVFQHYYYLQTPEELIQSKLGVCWDQVELERDFLTKRNIKVKTYFIETYYSEENIPSHTFLTFKLDNKYYWYEHSWNNYKGVHKYKSIKELLKDIKKKFIKSHDTNLEAPTLIYEYNTPPSHINCNEFYKYAEKSKLIKINEPCYFYHIIDKEADITKGILSLKYMYDNKMYELFDKHAEKYKYRIVSSWNIEKYKGRKEETLTRSEIIDALEIFRGQYGPSYIYFFKFPPQKTLGKKMGKILKDKNIYRININDEELILKIKDIFYGLNIQEVDKTILTKSYYEKITPEEYFKNYDDTLEMNFNTLNHISIAFIDDYCPNSFIEKI